MPWEVLRIAVFDQWFETLTVDQQDSLIARIELVEQAGPSLGRPTVDRIEGSRHHNMKELRTSKEGALRVLFIFDPLRQAVLLLGGDKTGNWDEWYRKAIPVADDLYDEYLSDVRDEGML